MTEPQPPYQQPPYQQPSYQQASHQQPPYQQASHQQPSYQQPSYQQPSYQQPSYQQPPYQEQPSYQQPSYQQPSYLSMPPEAVEALVRKGRRDITFGALWLLFGLVITLFSLSEFDGFVIVAWGPALYGIYKIIKGVLTVRKYG